MLRLNFKADKPNVTHAQKPQFKGVKKPQNSYVFFQGQPATSTQDTTKLAKTVPFTSIYDTKGLNFATSKISFKGSQYWGMDPNPLKKLLYITNGQSMDKIPYDPGFALDHTRRGEGGAGWKKWIQAHPAELLKRSLSDTVMTITTLNDSGIPDWIKTPDFGNSWGERANYIEIIPRVLGKIDNDKMSEGIFGAMKLLPAIPASSNSAPNCVLLSQLYPTIYGDGYAKGGYEESSQYTTKLNVGLSQDLISNWAERDGTKLSPEEQIAAFNDLAHLRGLKTGFRMNLSADQMRVGDGSFNWHYNQEDFINACCHGVNLGFDCIFFDSAKHVGGYDMGNYHGCGDLPDFGKMQYILNEVRSRTGRGDVQFVGEMCCDNPERYKHMGLNAGTGGRNSCWGFASGESVSGFDNDGGGTSYENRLNGINHGLFDEHSGQKMPMFMNMSDLFPLNHSTNVHDLMIHNKSFSAYGDAGSHWNNIFAGGDAAWNYIRQVNDKFAWAANK